MVIINEEDAIRFSGEEIVVYQKRMLEKMDWVCPYRWEDETLIYHKIPEDEAEDLLAVGRRLPSGEEIKALISCLMFEAEVMEQHFLDRENVWTDPQWIFWKREEKAVRLLYLPFRNGEGERVPFLFRAACMLWELAVENEWQDAEAILEVFHFLTELKKREKTPVLSVVEKTDAEEWEKSILEEVILGEGGEQFSVEIEAGESIKPPEDSWETKKAQSLEELTRSDKEQVQPLEELSQFQEKLREKWLRWWFRWQIFWEHLWHPKKQLMLEDHSEYPRRAR